VFDVHPIGFAIGLYLIGMVAIAWWARGRVTSVEDFVLAGRTLGLRIITSSLLATWVGAGTLLVAADEIHREGLSVTALDPIGSAAALFVGALMAPRIRAFRVVTLPDLFRKMYGPRAEGLLAAIVVPADMLWVAVQYLALGSIIELYIQVPLEWAVPAIALVGVTKTMVGGLHSIAMTDTVQLGAIVSSMAVLAIACLYAVGGGDPAQGILALGQLEPEHLAVLPDTQEVLPWVGLLLAASLGQAADPTLVQRVSAARTPTIAWLACVISGFAYLVVGLAPVVVGLTASLVMPNVKFAVMPALAGLLLNPWFAAIIVVTMVATMLSTIDSSLMSPSTILVHNVGARMLGLKETVALHRLSLFLVAVATLGFSLTGIRPFRLMTLAYEIGMVATVVPVLLGMWWPADEETCLASIGVGGTSWLFFTISGRPFLGTDLPPAIGSLLLAALVYMVLAWLRGHPPAPRQIDAVPVPGPDPGGDGTRGLHEGAD